MRTFFFIFATAPILIWTVCQRCKDGLQNHPHQIPSDLGRGLKPADSLKALLDWLSIRKGYASETLRLHCLYELIRILGREKPDTLFLLAQTLSDWAEGSSYPIAKGIVLLGYAEAFWAKSQTDSALARTQEALQLFEKRGSLSYAAKAYNLMGKVAFSRNKWEESILFYEKSISLYQIVMDSLGLATGYNNIAVVHYIRGRYAEALDYQEKARQIREALRDFRGIADSYNNIANIYRDQGYYTDALKYYYRASQIQQSLGDQQGLASVYNNIATIYYARSQYAEALQYYQKALSLWESLGEQRGLSYAYQNIANIYSDQGYYDQALNYYQKALYIRQKIGDKQKIASSYDNIATVYHAQGCYEEAMNYHQKALQIQESLGDLKGLAYSYYNIGTIYYARGLYQEAISYSQKSLSIREKLGDLQGMAYIYDKISGAYIHQGLYQEARPYCYKALSIAQRLALRDLLRMIYFHLARADSGLAASGQTAYWKSAYEHQRLHTAYKDSVFNEESIRRQAQLESQYEYEKKTALLKAQQDKERALAQAEIQRREIQRNLSLLALFIAILGLSILTYFFFIIRRQKRQLQEANAALTESNRIIQAQAEELKEKNADLEVFNAELEAANKALTESNQVIQLQAEALIEKNEEILASIRYAERIQRAILPSQEKWERLLPNSFLIYQPKDIVAGDFYWLEETDKYVFLGIADATGHGVPGALVSLVCTSALNRALRLEGLESPAAILAKAKALISELLTQEGGKLRDGMDIALIRFEKGNPGKLSYAGANRPLWVISTEKEVIELGPTRQPVGYTEVDRPFEEVEVDLGSRLPVMVYGFTDGIVDQMGGPQGRKLLPKGLRQTLLEWYELPVKEQAERLGAFLREWRGEIGQMDDMTLVGIRVE